MLIKHLEILFIIITFLYSVYFDLIISSLSKISIKNYGHNIKNYSLKQKKSIYLQLNLLIN